SEPKEDNPDFRGRVPVTVSGREKVTAPTASTIEEPIVAADDTAAVVDLPSMGFAWIATGEEKPTLSTSKKKTGWFHGKKSSTPPPLAQEDVLRNEFFEAHIDQHSGG
ncbi:MAG: hypothetical protein ACWGMZ_11200, partial [Thermoguttaceae bacterium]